MNATVTRNNVVPGNWASVRGGKWHLLPGVALPNFREDATSLCGVTFEPLNVTGGEAPPTHDAHICAHCVRASTQGRETEQ